MVITGPMGSVRGVHLPRTSYGLCVIHMGHLQDSVELARLLLLRLTPSVPLRAHSPRWGRPLEPRVHSTRARVGDAPQKMDVGISRGVTEWPWEQASGQEAWMARPCRTCSSPSSPPALEGSSCLRPAPPVSGGLGHRWASLLLISSLVESLLVRFSWSF